MTPTELTAARLATLIERAEHDVQTQIGLGWTRHASTRSEELAALRIAARVLAEDAGEKIARIMEPEIWQWIDEGHRPRSTARAARSLEIAQAVISYLKGEE